MTPELISTIWTQTSTIDLPFFNSCLRERVSLPDHMLDLAGDSPVGEFLRENPEWWRVGENILTWCRRNNAAITYPGEAFYPAGFSALEDPPLFLSYFGSPCWLNERVLSIVGSREPTDRALTWMECELPQLAAGGMTFVSGGARGVDQRAHAISIRLSTPTVAFLPSGLEFVYPDQFRDWIDPIVDRGGAVVSELAPWNMMLKHYFLKRNRMIAAVSSVTLIVEARKQSGTMITARRAIECDRQLAVLPGPPADPRCAGNLRLLADGASMVCDAWDLLTLLNLNVVKLRR